MSKTVLKNTESAGKVVFFKKREKNFFCLKKRDFENMKFEK